MDEQQGAQITSAQYDGIVQSVIDLARRAAQKQGGERRAGADAVVRVLEQDMESRRASRQD